VQLAAMKEEASARALSARLSARYPAIHSELSPAFEVKEIEGRGRFHRVQFVGLSSHEEARDLCARLRAIGQDCFVPEP
jgi:cell division septation protein DedD